MPPETSNLVSRESQCFSKAEQRKTLKFKIKLQFVDCVRQTFGNQKGLINLILIGEEFGSHERLNLFLTFQTGPYARFGFKISHILFVKLLRARGHNRAYSKHKLVVNLTGGKTTNNYLKCIVLLVSLLQF